MDSKGFRIKGELDSVYQPTYWAVRQETAREFNATKTTAAPDNRFRAYAAPLEDGRLVTDYRQSCVTRAPYGKQSAVKAWTVHSADEIIRLTRERQLQDTGHVLGTADTVPPAAEEQTCDVNRCRMYGTGATFGIGLERTDKCPELFGTFDAQPNAATLAKNKVSIALNSVNEYGRNTTSRWAHLYQ